MAGNATINRSLNPLMYFLVQETSSGETVDMREEGQESERPTSHNRWARRFILSDIWMVDSLSDVANTA